MELSRLVAAMRGVKNKRRSYIMNRSPMEKLNPMNWAYQHRVAAGILGGALTVGAAFGIAGHSEAQAPVVPAAVTETTGHVCNTIVKICPTTTEGQPAPTDSIKVTTSAPTTSESTTTTSEVTTTTRPTTTTTEIITTTTTTPNVTVTTTPGGSTTEVPTPTTGPNQSVPQHTN